MSEARTPVGDFGREPDAVRAEASAWVARLKSPRRAPQTDQAFRDWIDADPTHASAFQKATEVWELLGGVSTPVKRVAPRRSLAPMLMAASLAAVALGTAGWWVYVRTPTYVTEVGEQRVVRLSDGTRLTLNTGTKVSVNYHGLERRVRLDRGEAIFDVAKNKHRPFIVTAADEEVRALGTSFVVRREEQTVTVTLIEGKVSVAGAVQGQESASHKAQKPILLAPGQRVKVRNNSVASLDRPALDRVTDWRRGDLVFDETPLSEAIAEMNRYDTTVLAIEAPAAAELRISGIFKTGQTDEFARTVSRLYGLGISKDSDRILLTGGPTQK